MALIIFTDTYISLDDARTYVADNGLTDSFPADDTEAETLLRRAAKAIDRKYGQHFLGFKSVVGQPMAWPRIMTTGEVYALEVDSDGNPRNFSVIQPELGEAQVELAILMNDGASVLTQQDGALTNILTKAGDVESQKTYSAPFQASDFYGISLILRPLLERQVGISCTRGA